MKRSCVFYVVRHAHAVWTPDEDRPLSAEGKKDALRVADVLCRLPIAGIYSSPYRRAVETVQPLADRLNLATTIEADLRERTLGNPRRATGFLSAVKQTWDDPAFAYPGGEANAVAQRRGVAVVERLAAGCDKGHVVLSTHGTLMALVLQHFDSCVDFIFWKTLTMPDIYALRLEGSSVSIDHLWQGPNEHPVTA